MHRLSEVDEIAMKAWCFNCGPVEIRKKKDSRLPRGFTYECREKRRSEQRAAKRPPGRSRKYTKKSHGMTVEQARAFRAGKACSICGSQERLAVDHCHSTLKVRGVLCTKCNAGLGMFSDDPERLRKAAAYLEMHQE